MDKITQQLEPFSMPIYHSGELIQRAHYIIISVSVIGPDQTLWLQNAKCDTPKIHIQFPLKACYGSLLSREWVCMMKQHVDSTSFTREPTLDPDGAIAHTSLRLPNYLQLPRVPTWYLYIHHILFLVKFTSVFIITAC